MKRRCKPLRIGYVVGALGRGGAEMQLLRLAKGLVERGHMVGVIAYDGPSVLDDDFRAMGVDLVADASVTRKQKIRTVRDWMQRSRFDVVHGIMKRASSLALLARWPERRPPVVASDYSSATYGRRNVALWASLAAFAYADHVVTEIELNRNSIVRLAPWLRGKTIVVRNGLDTDLFVPAPSAPSDPGAKFTFCVVGTLSTLKNPLRVIDAVAELRRRGRTDFRVDWYGRDGLVQHLNVGEQARTRARSLGLDRHLVFHGDTPNVKEAYQRADALLHASIQEGFPNVVAEGMACGLPLVVSRVSDLPQVVTAARNGFMFDETDPHAIADAMGRLMALSADERAAMGARSRELAVRWFRIERFLDDFEDLYYASSERGA